MQRYWCKDLHARSVGVVQDVGARFFRQFQQRGTRGSIVTPRREFFVSQATQRLLVHDDDDNVDVGGDGGGDDVVVYDDNGYDNILMTILMLL